MKTISRNRTRYLLGPKSWHTFPRYTQETPQLYHCTFIEGQSETAARRGLRVVRINLQISKQQRLAARLAATARGLNGHKDGVDLLERLGVVKLHNPPFLGGAILKKDSKVHGFLHVRSAAAPGLEGSRVPDSGLLVQVIGVEEQRFALGVEDAPARLLCRAVASHVIDFGDVEVPRTHQVTNVSIVGQKVVLLVDRLLAVAKLTVQIHDLGL